MEANDLRKKTDELEKSIKFLVDKFREEVGYCEIKIESDINYHEHREKKYITSTSLKVSVIV